MSGKQAKLFSEPVAFGPGFMSDHAGHIIADQQVAIVELIANAYDAGATQVDVQWPAGVGGTFVVSDNGTGMTPDEFQRRWRMLSYKRLLEQGEEVTFPAGVKGKRRVAFGQNGKGRHGAFCFSTRYEIETWQDGKSIRIQVSLTDGGAEPFHCEPIEEKDKKGHGTCITAAVQKTPLPVSMIRETIGSKFLVDPSFSVSVNSQKLVLPDLKDLESVCLEVPPDMNVKVHYIDASRQDRTTQLHGITWWVNNRMVGHSSWDELDGTGAILDGRTTLAKRTSFVVEADCLKPHVKDDWSGFHDSQQTLQVRQIVRQHVIQKLSTILSEGRKEKKAEALAETREALKKLPQVSRRMVSKFVDEVQTTCPSLSQGDLVRTVQIYTKLETARSGYELLERLAACSPTDLDTWNHLMEEWDASSADIVLGELKRRLDLIAQLQGLVHATTTDELHELQPLFARGLWIFGPEYEAADFLSNRSMATVIRKLLGDGGNGASSSRPDFVALPDRSIGVYSADHFDSDGEVCGIRKVLIVELKKGGFRLNVKELRQAEDYALELQKTKQVKANTELVAFVLGAEIDEGASEDRVAGKIRIVPMKYEVVLKRAHARTFHLQRQLEAVRGNAPLDPAIEEALKSAEPLLESARIGLG